MKNGISIPIYLMLLLSGKVKGTYGTATARQIADVLLTQADEDAGRGTKDELNYRGLKYLKKEMIDNQCAGILAPSDWMYVKAGRRRRFNGFRMENMACFCKNKM